LKGHGLSHGAATIVNAIATGKGAAFGVDLRTEAWVELNDSGNVDASSIPWSASRPAVMGHRS
jgi:shikimate kinase